MKALVTLLRRLLGSLWRPLSRDAVAKRDEDHPADPPAGERTRASNAETGGRAPLRLEDAAAVNVSTGAAVLGEATTGNAASDFLEELAEDPHQGLSAAAETTTVAAMSPAPPTARPVEPSSSMALPDAPAGEVSDRAMGEVRSPEPEAADETVMAFIRAAETAPDAAHPPAPPAAPARVSVDEHAVPEPHPAEEPKMKCGPGAEPATPPVLAEEPDAEAEAAPTPLQPQIGAGRTPDPEEEALVPEAPEPHRGVLTDGDPNTFTPPMADAAVPKTVLGTGTEDRAHSTAAPPAPPTYRPRLQRARRSQPTVPAPRTPGPGSERTQMEADLQISFRPGDFGIRLSALLRRPADTEDVAVSMGGEQSELGPLDDRLLEPLPLDDIVTVLSNGLLVEASDLPVVWRRSSRALHVFGARPSVTGFGTIPRIVIGQENVVVCADALAQAAADQIAATGAPQPTRIDGPGVPPGWVCWRGVRPLRPATPAVGDAILHALDPLPAILIEMSGGLQLSRGTWLEGRPPSIRLLGTADGGDSLRIDGDEAQAGQDDGWTSPGWERPGRHHVEYGGVTASYEIASPEAGAPWWPAHSGPRGELSGALSGPDGPLHLCHDRSAFLIGAVPGQVCGFAGQGGGMAVARPHFDPVWRVSRTGRRQGATLVGSPRPLSTAQKSASAVECKRWARAIKSAGRSAGLDPDEAELWRRYFDCARSIIRRGR